MSRPRSQSRPSTCSTDRRRQRSASLSFRLGLMQTRATQPLAQRDNKQRTKPPVSSNLTAASGRTGSSRHNASVSHISARFQGSQKTPQVKRGSCAVVLKGAFKKKLIPVEEVGFPHFKRCHHSWIGQREIKLNQMLSCRSLGNWGNGQAAWFCFYIFVWPAKCDSEYIIKFQSDSKFVTSLSLTAFH